jgi:hypothetical protein
MMNNRSVEDMDGFWVSREHDRTLHIGFEDEETLYFDLFDTAKAGNPWHDGGDCMAAVFINLKTGEVRVEHEKGGT